jgi:hypothetical protein
MTCLLSAHHPTQALGSKAKVKVVKEATIKKKDRNTKKKVSMEESRKGLADRR